MKVIKQSFIMDDDTGDIIKDIERRARICYKSEDKTTDDSAKKFVSGIVKHGHNSCMEMSVVSVAMYYKTYEDACNARKSILSHDSLKFLEIDAIFNTAPWLSKGVLLITGSIRAWYEAIECNGNSILKTAFDILSNSEYTKDIISIVSENRDTLKFAMNNRIPSKETNAGYKGEAIVGQISSIDYEYEVRDFGPSPVMMFGEYTVCGFASHHTANRIFKRHKFQGVKFITNRAVSHEGVRHRRMGILQESQRYCRYSGDQFGNEVTFIDPIAFNFSDEDKAIWKDVMEYCEKAYMKLIKNNSPQAARTVLPNSCKIEYIIYCNLTEWMHIFAMRCNSHAEPSMQESMIPVQKAFIKRWPELHFKNPKRSIGGY